MDNTSPRPDAHYKFRFTPLLIGLGAIGLVLCVAGIAYASWMFFDFLSNGDLSSIYDWIKIGLIYLVSVLFAVLITAMLIRSQYVITDTHFITQFGLIRQKFELKKIFSVHLFKGANKLAVYFDDFKTDYTVIVVKEEWYADFIRELTERNERIAFSFSSAEEEEEFLRKK